MAKSDHDNFDNHSNKLILEFDNKDAANHFKHWLCGQGEQDYWMWMEYREQEDEGNITGIEFNYHTNSDVIKIRCGRMDKEE